MNLSIEFWLGTALAIPMSIAATILAPKFQDYIDKRSSKASEKRAKTIKKELEDITAYKKDASLFYVYLLEAGIKIAFYSAIFGLFSGLLFMGASMVGTLSYKGYDFYLLVSAINSVGQGVVVFGTLIIISISTKAIRVINRYRNYEKFKNEVSSILINSEST
ncbi:hypothetical protein ACXHQL_24515 [Vibrio parahaemolyticus]|uniref:hypothetical protein n=1 Tax=Vibrio parahaemolyticus TaxID=670 RepID=UPI001D16D58F|nr:hypothetical protein [Vibrio parahaemolyticus]MCC3798619.1 hypothetical protein [Vibrio parahaemolyticus]MCC3813390.1 hypothetical protein [Vibrio parahaemolyticus]